MQSDEERLKRRFEELSARAFSSGRPMFSDFLGLGEQEILKYSHLSGECQLDGGYDGAERAVARFGESFIDFPIVCLRIQPKSAKFADDLSHRDFLGSLTGLGLRREVLGDIVVSENSGYLFCLESVSDFIVNSLEKVRHTDVSVTICDEPPILSALPPEEVFNVASERLDAVIAAIYNISRAGASELIAAGKVFINGREKNSAGAQLSEGDRVSVRGSGRFVYCGISGETRKGRLRVLARVYGK